MRITAVVGLFQLIFILIMVAALYTMYSLVSYVNWKRRHDIEQSTKLDKLIALLEEQKRP
ncbi:hypothetical protein [Brevibacillus dissolubilis]|uniref:hypothetical protein n=1 Tax=Brevibacillus dissolubilis TaxID=1844116 RepID=UPI001117A759|nr:hypothetical protein [Brevibacillus dissolubilis]